MAPQSSKGKGRLPSSRPTVNLVKFESSASSSQRFDPLTAFSSQSLDSQSTNGHTTSQHLLKASQSSYKGKAKVNVNARTRAEDGRVEDRMWVDIYEPTNEAELAVHKRKVEDVRRWLLEAFEGGPFGSLMKYRRILALTGPAGTGKTATVRVLAREMGFDIMEWKNPIGEKSHSMFDESNDANSSSGYKPTDSESIFSKFEVFLNRASACHNLFSTPISKTTNSATQSSQASVLPQKRHIILLEDLPNLLHPATQSQFYSALQSLVTFPVANPPVPVIVIISDAGVRGEITDERMTNGGGWIKSRDGIVDIRTVFPRELLGGPFVTQISFNPIAPTLLTKALKALVDRHFSKSTHSPPTGEVLDVIVESANGDIRSAIMALQFASVVEMTSKTKKKKASDKSKIIVLESVTRREQSLVLFHLLGKVLYNKRKGDPPSSSTKKDIQKEKMADEQLKDPLPLPFDFKDHERRTSRIDVDVLYANSPIDSSLFSLYIHQNYPQFCDDIDQCDGVVDWLSWIDSNGGDTWYQANPHQFHLLTLGTIHSLPSPVTRRSQAITKPVFFDCLQKEKSAWEGVRDARGWALGDGTSQTDLQSGWSHSQVAVELGGLLNAREKITGGSLPRPPSSHRLFSSLKFSSGSHFGLTQSLHEKDADIPRINDGDDSPWLPRRDVEADGGWLESDDIEEF